MKTAALSVVIMAVCASCLTLPALAGAPRAVTESSLESALGEIRESQRLTDDERIRCDDVTSEQLEKLGEALMEIAYPNPRQHALTSEMMGGEGSDALAAMHRTMGARYLACYSDEIWGPSVQGPGVTGGMMGHGGMGHMSGYGGMSRLPDYQRMQDRWIGGPMMGWGMTGGMGQGHWGFMPWGGGSLVFWIVIIAAVVIIVYLLARSPGTSGPSAGEREDALSILRRRYASGEITKDQFEEMRDTLKRK